MRICKSTSSCNCNAEVTLKEEVALGDGLDAWVMASMLVEDLNASGGAIPAAR